MTFRKQGEALGSKAEEQMLFKYFILFKYFMLSLERGTLLQSIPWMVNLGIQSHEIIQGKQKQTSDIAPHLYTNHKIAFIPV